MESRREQLQFKSGADYIEQVKHQELWQKAAGKLPTWHKVLLAFAVVLTLMPFVTDGAQGTLISSVILWLGLGFSHINRRLDAIEKIAKSAYRKDKSSSCQ